MDELKGKSKSRAILKIVISALVEVLLVYMSFSIYEDGEEFAAIFCFILWSIVCLIYFISGFKALFDDNKLLKEYLNSSNITIEELEEELKIANKIGNVFIGNKHIFSSDYLGVVVIPIESITKLEIVHLGANAIKRRRGYYYLYIYSNVYEQKRKIYSITDNSFKKVVEEIKKVNANVI